MTREEIARALNLPGASVETLQKAIIEWGNTNNCRLFARDIEGADIPALQNAVMELGDSTDLYLFAKEIPTADRSSIRQRLHELALQGLDSNRYLFQFDQAFPMDRLEIPEYGIVIENGTITHTLYAQGDDEETWNAAMDGITSMILAHRMAGVDVTGDEYLTGLRVAIDACANNLESLGTNQDGTQSSQLTHG